MPQTPPTARVPALLATSFGTFPRKPVAISKLGTSGIVNFHHNFRSRHVAVFRFSLGTLSKYAFSELDILRSVLISQHFFPASTKFFLKAVTVSDGHDSANERKLVTHGTTSVETRRPYLTRSPSVNVSTSCVPGLSPRLAEIVGRALPL